MTRLQSVTLQVSRGRQNPVDTAYDVGSVRENTVGVIRDLPPVFPFHHHTRGLVARRLFRVPPCRQGTVHLQTSMPSPGFQPYGTAVSAALLVGRHRFR
ncbi:hypothetical protein TNCV_3398761 [Trichonephila clavipes]|nr:hypothetical protein TNCV_3398761 [Trichonephila clavipes]